MPLHTVSIVNFTEECALLSVSRKLDAVAIFGMMVNVMTTLKRRILSFVFKVLCFNAINHFIFH